MTAAVRTYLDALTEQWIGWSMPPVVRAIEDAGWAPDRPDVYCRRCGSSVGPGEATGDGCGSCRGRPALGDGVVRLGAYAGPLREWVLAIKYRGWAEMGVRLGRALGQSLADSGLANPGRCVVVPIPMPWQRRLYRGIDHARVIAGGAADVLDAPLLSVLARSNGVPQVALRASQRRHRGALGLRLRRRLGGWPLGPWQVVVIDDVRTSGSTLRAASRVLRVLRPQRVLVGVLSAADEPARRAPGRH
jgi:predicted amidophosphoribosyltransferase